MLKIDMSAMDRNLRNLPDEEMIPTTHLNPYLLASIIHPILNGETIRYCEVDYNQFDDLDLQNACDYCSDLNRKAYQLAGLSRAVWNTEACAISQRIFC